MPIDPKNLPPKPTGFDPPPPEARVSPKEIDTQPAMPAVRVEAAPAWFAAFQRQQDANHDLLVNALDGIKEEQRVARRDIIELQAFKEETKRKYSGPIKKVSDHTLENEAAIGRIVVKVDSLEQGLKVNTAETLAVKSALTKNTDATMAIKGAVVDGVTGFFKRNPKLELALAMLILAAIGVATNWLKGLGL